MQIFRGDNTQRISDSSSRFVAKRSFFFKGSFPKVNALNQIFTELAPRPIQSINCDGRVFVVCCLSSVPSVSNWNKEIWRLLVKEYIAKKKRKVFALLVGFEFALGILGSILLNQPTVHTGELAGTVAVVFDDR